MILIGFTHTTGASKITQDMVLIFDRSHNNLHKTFQGENGDLKNRGIKVEINHIGLPSAEKPNPDLPDSSIGEGMDISIQGANGHVKHNNDNQSIRSHESVTHKPNIDLLAPPPTTESDDKFTYSDMSIGHGMDISIRGECELNETKESYDENGWKVNGRENGFEGKEAEPEQDQKEEEDPPDEIKFIQEAVYDPVDEVVVEDCCPEVCYRTCPCCIGDPDSPFWQMWYRHRLQVSRYGTYSN